MKLKHCLFLLGLFFSAVLSAQPFRKSYEDIMIPKDNSFLYAMVPGLYDNLHTESSDVEMVSLESMIDRERALEEDFKGYHIIQIPFKDQEERMSVSLSGYVQHLLSLKNPSTVKKFLVLVADKMTSDTMSIVTTFIPTQKCLMEYGPDSFSYMDKSTYDGIVINSNLDGSFRSVYIYGDHPIIDGRIYDVGYEDDARYRYYLTLSKPCGTKEGDNGEIVGSVCIGVDKDVSPDMLPVVIDVEGIKPGMAISYSDFVAKFGQPDRYGSSGSDLGLSEDYETHGCSFHCAGGVLRGFRIVDRSYRMLTYFFKNGVRIGDDFSVLEFLQPTFVQDLEDGASLYALFEHSAGDILYVIVKQGKIVSVSFTRSVQDLEIS